MSLLFGELPRLARTYVTLVIAAGSVAIGHSVVSLIREPIGTDWLILPALTLLTGSFSIKIPTVNARISVSEAFVFAGVFAFGANVATLIVALDALVLTSWVRGPSRSVLRASFNMSSGAIAIALACRLFDWLLTMRPATDTPLGQLLMPVAVLALVYFGINSWLVAIALGFELKAPAIRIWQRNFVWVSLNYFGGASVGLLLVTYAKHLNLASVGVIVPLLIIFYLTFRTSMARVNDASKHVAQVNELYLSTIETLAMAVDAKDQITHGHIRRVQVYATELAKRLGVSDAQQLKAIETAALLHDMGKLAIPEHILNKPGPLTPAEFQRMKQHADLGADLLSSIRFPYPVVPIVRHHHESWDGTGYPNGISRTDIPLGARILAVVDCFDALTSDRPYRPRLTVEDAFAILRERRGTTYDPIVVDTFSKAFPDIAPAAIRAGEEARSMLIPIGTGDTPHLRGPLKQIRANASESALLSECRRDISRSVSSRHVLEAAAQCLRQLTPAHVFALYRHHAETDNLTCEVSVGEDSHLINALSIKTGQRITGWSAANRRTSVNADASLDLGQISVSFDPPLRSTITVPLVVDDRLFGVLTAYSRTPAAFNETHEYAFEQVAASIVEGVVGRSPSAHQTNITAFPKNSF
jgi:putative nucleotidyltransferase with HDIG domain